MEGEPQGPGTVIEWVSRQEERSGERSDLGLEPRASPAAQEETTDAGADDSAS